MSDVNNATDSGAAPTSAPQEDAVVAKYKKLLAMARTSLEGNQATLQAKDKLIGQLQKALEDEKALTARGGRRGGGLGAGKDDDALVPRNLLRRVDVDELIWLLVEYEAGADDSWMCFGSEQELVEFVQRIPGAPLTIPQRSFSPAESQRVESEARKRVERVVEEFRRYKVKAEIARKNRDAENKVTAQRAQAGAGGQTPPSMSASAHASGLPSLLDKSQADGTMGDGSVTDELQRLKGQLTEQEAKWRAAYEKVVKENELLRTRGGEAVLATQWRERYEACQREKDDLAEKLKLLKGHGDGGGGAGQKSLEQAYAELRDEYKDFRRRVASELQQRMADGGDLSPGPTGRPFGDSWPSPMPPYMANGMGMGGGGGGGGRSLGLGESKVQYIKHMVFQYLSCKDPSVKPHMESALIALFRFSEGERAAIEEQRKADTVDTIASITNFLGSFASS